MRASTRYSLLFFSALLLIYLLALDDIAKPMFEREATEMYGAQVSIERMKISPFVGKVTLFDLQVADRTDPMRNLAAAERVYFDIDMPQLARDILELESLVIDGFVVFSQRAAAAEIRRPLLAAESDLAQATLPNPDLNQLEQLAESQRAAFAADLQQLREQFISAESKWLASIETLPDEATLDAYLAQLAALPRDSDGALRDPQAVLQARTIQQTIDNELARIEALRLEFMREVEQLNRVLDEAPQLANLYTQQLLSSRGMEAEQTARLANQLLRGDLKGVLQQVLAPIAFSSAGTIDDGPMPIYIADATINGPLLPSASGLQVAGNLNDFVWPLHLASQAATLVMSGEDENGGTLQISAIVDHSAAVDDTVSVTIDNLTFSDMQLAGNPQLDITMQQTRVSVSGKMTARGDELSGSIEQHYTDTVMNVVPAATAGEAARLIADMMATTDAFKLQMDFSGTVHSPVIHFSSDMDAHVEAAVSTRLAAEIAAFTEQLSQRFRTEVGPEIVAARDRVDQLEMLGEELQTSLQRLNELQR